MSMGNLIKRVWIDLQGRIQIPRSSPNRFRPSNPHPRVQRLSASSARQKKPPEELIIISFILSCPTTRLWSVVNHQNSTGESSARRPDSAALSRPFLGLPQEFRPGSTRPRDPSRLTGCSGCQVPFWQGCLIRIRVSTDWPYSLPKRIFTDIHSYLMLLGADGKFGVQEARRR